MKSRIIYLAVNLIVAMICFYKGSAHAGYELIGFLPALFSVCLLVSQTIHGLSSKYIGCKFFFIVMWLRYTVMPLMIALSGDVTGIGFEPEASSINKAILMMMFEMVCVFAVINTAGKHILLKNKLEQSFTVDKSDGGTPVFYIILILLSIAFIAVYKDLLNNFSFGVFDNSSVTTSHFLGLDVRIIIVAKMALVCMILGRMGKLYLIKQNNIFYLVALVACLIYIVIFKGENRASVLITIVPALMVLKAAFPQKYKVSRNIIIISGVTMLLALTFYRIYAVTSWRPSGGSQEINIEYFSQALQSYLSGPRGIAIGIEAMDYFKNEIGIKTFSSDMLIWTGYLGNYISKSFNQTFLGTSIMHNLYLYRFNMYGEGDQIIPMCVQSYAYFGYIGSAIFTMLSVYFLVLFDAKICRARTPDGIYINTMFAIVLSLLMGYNVSILMMYFFDRYMIFLLASMGNRALSYLFKKNSQLKNINYSENLKGYIPESRSKLLFPTRKKAI